MDASSELREEGVKLFVCDDKYDVIISSLQELGWQRCQDYEMIPSSCRFIFRNLSNIKFSAVFDRFVNHFRNSQHLSNKALFAYHLRGAGLEELQTPTWSAAFEDIPSLIGMVLLNSIKCFIISIGIPSADISKSTEEAAQNLRDGAKSRFDVLHEMAQALRMDEEWREKNKKLDGELIYLLDQIRSYILAQQNLEALREKTSNECADVLRQGSDDIWMVKAVGASCGQSIIPVRGLREVKYCTGKYIYRICNPAQLLIVSFTLMFILSCWK